MRITILPKSLLGKWSVGLAAASSAFFAFSEVLTSSVPTGLVFKILLAVALSAVLAGIAGGCLCDGVRQRAEA